VEENFEPVARTRANYYTPGSPVQFVCVELLKGEVSGEHAVCLTFKNISRVTLTALEIHFKCKGVDGVILCEDEFEYRDLTAKPGESFGMDDAVFVTQKAITSVDVTLRNVYSGRKVVHLESIKRVRLPAPRRLSVEMQKALEARMNRTGMKFMPQVFENGWYCACGAFHPKEEDTVYCSECGSDRILLQNALNTLLQPEAPVRQPETEPQPAAQPEPAPQPEKKSRRSQESAAREVEQHAQEVSQAIEEELAEPEEAYQYPPVTLLDQNSDDNYTEVGAELRNNSRRLAQTITSFGVDAKPGDVVHGPSVTRYEFTLDQGVKLSKLTNLADDIALALGSGGVRIAPIPNKSSVVGIEVPNRVVTAVRIRDVIDSRAFAEHKSRVAFAVGKDIGGNAIVGDIAKLPHVLIAGTTGSGKSVCTNSLIVSLLYKSTPEEVRFIMVDPKMVELAPYNGIPHLLIPVVTDPKKAAGALQWAVYEMMKRYKLFSENGVKDLAGFNALAQRNEELKKMPTVVVVIDELADLMLVAAKEVEESICRVAQMGRAAGMHLVIATQRPSSDVITGLMKANIPSRIAFAVASSLESRIILDTTGAEKLVGKGDMLYAPLGAGKPTRVQGCFITPEEIERVVDYVKQSGEAEYSQDVMDKIEQAVKEKEKSGKSAGAPEPAGESPDDELLTAAVDVVLETGQASVSMLQRRLKLGYARAARLVDQMEERGYVGPFEGSKPRQLLIDKAKWQELKMAKAPAPEPEIDRNGSIRDVFESRDALD